MSIKELRELLNKIEAEVDSEDVEIMTREGEIGCTQDILYGYGEQDTEGNWYAILHID